MKVLKISAPNSSSFSFHVNLKFRLILLEIAKNKFSKKVTISKIFFEKSTFAKCLEIYIMVVVQKNFKFFNVTNFQNLSNPPYWILKTQKNVNFSKSVQNCCCYECKIGKI